MRTNWMFAVPAISSPASTRNFRFCRSSTVRLSGSCSFSIFEPLGKVICFAFVPANNASPRRGHWLRSTVPLRLARLRASTRSRLGHDVMSSFSTFEVTFPATSSPTFSDFRFLEAMASVALLDESTDKLDRSPRSSSISEAIMYTLVFVPPTPDSVTLSPCRTLFADVCAADCPDNAVGYKSIAGVSVSGCANCVRNVTRPSEVSL